MKNQKGLLETGWCQAPDVEIEPFSVHKYKNCFGEECSRKRANYLYRCEKVMDALVVTIFCAGGEPLFRSFMDKNALKSQYYKGAKPSDCTVKNFLWNIMHIYYREQHKIETDEASRTVVDEWLKDKGLIPLRSGESPINAIEEHQRGIRRRAVERRNDKIRKSVDDVMLEIKPLPKKFDEWLDKVVFKASRYIVYEYSGRKLQKGWCTNCETNVLVEGAKSHKRGKCPNCKSDVEYIATGKMQERFSDHEECVYIQPDKNGDPIFRYFEVSRHFHTYDWRTYSVNTYVHEQSRWFYGSGKKYDWDNFRQTGEMRFCDVSYRGSFGSGFVYPYNMKKVFGNAVKCNGRDYINYIPFVDLLKNQKESLNPHNFYVSVIQKPIIEYLAKLKLYSLCHDVISGEWNNEYFNSEGQNFKKVFPKGITRRDLRIASEKDFGVKTLLMYLSNKDAITEKRLLSGIDFWRHGQMDEDCIKLLKYASPEKVVGYAEKMKARHSWSDNLREKTGDWADYIGFAERLGWDLKDEFILFPRDFWEAHDRANGLIKIENVKKQNKAVRKRAKVLDKEYRMDGKQFFIRAAASAEEIVKEGQALHHCVATYVDRVVNGACGILVMRSVKEPDKPLYTIEVRDGVLIQCRGKNNRDMDKKSEKTFFGKWKATKLRKVG